MQFDTILAGGLVVDGSGATPVRAASAAGEDAFATGVPSVRYRAAKPSQHPSCADDGDPPHRRRAAPLQCRTAPAGVQQ